MSRLLEILKATPAKEVNVEYSKVVEELGEKTADELAIFAVQKNEVMRGRASRRSAIPPNKRIRQGGYAAFNRDELIKALEGKSKASSPEKKGGPPKEVTS